MSSLYHFTAYLLLFAGSEPYLPLHVGLAVRYYAPQELRSTIQSMAEEYGFLYDNGLIDHEFIDGGINVIRHRAKGLPDPGK